MKWFLWNYFRPEYWKKDTERTIKAGKETTKKSVSKCFEVAQTKSEKSIEK
ncbi:hypothetical protein [Metabacillus litoralis]|jgi:hypothetical protein|uniref:hypothetical protein n=1 Tax=Metabacillus litoralis TaxID=152268 RepID=UPI002041DD45|nr:hypothetical protein [Metabacillus litoralis]